MKSSFSLFAAVPARSAVSALALAGLLTFGCSSEPDSPPDAEPAVRSDPPTTSPGVPSITFEDSGVTGTTCDPPEVLLVVDRTMTMARTPDGTATPAAEPETSKLWQMTQALRDLVAPPADQGLRFGLMLWPRDPGPNADGDEQCLTLREHLSKVRKPTNPSCEGPEVAVSADLGTSTDVAAALDPETMHICRSTPTGSALEGALAALRATRVPGRPQVLMLVTDGADWDQTCPTPDPRIAIAKAAADGVSTFIVGFNAQLGGTNGVGKAFLNDMACAGKTAKDFQTACKPDPNHGFAALDPEGPVLFVRAQNDAELRAGFTSVTQSLCCNCVR